MPILSLLINGIKVLLVLGVGLGGHQIYGHIASNRFVDDGFFYYNSSILPTYNRNNALTKNKVFNSSSKGISIDDKWTKEDWRRESSTENYMSLIQDLSFRNKLDVINSYDHSSKRANIYKKIKEHTLKLVMPCQSGTGWLLDFEIPEDTWSYPTKWFIATNLHVINRFRFKENPYQASLPITEESLSYYTSGPGDVGSIHNLNQCQSSILNNKSELELYVEEDALDNFQVSHHIHKRTWQDHLRTRYYGSWNPIRSRIFTTKIKNPKLVYSAIDFLGNRFTASGHRKTSDSYFKDFGVLEVNFSSEEQAKLITNGIYNKYYRDIVHKTKNVYVIDSVESPINFFAEELMSKYDISQLHNSKDRYFIGGYPGGVSDNLSFTMNQQFQRNYYEYWNYTSIMPTDSKLTYFKEVSGINAPTIYNLKNHNGEIIPGHADLSEIDKSSDASKILWNGKQLNGWGYNYLINNSFLGSGASGSMVLNQDGDLLGLYRMYNRGFNYGFVEPLKGSWVVDKKGRVVLPGFDLLSGTGTGVVSYRTQLESKLPNMNSFLRSQNWALR